jgi:hypothetical protein
MGADISLGCLSGCLIKLAKSLEGPCQELLERLKTEPVLNIDETGHKENGKRLYTWWFNAKEFVVFVIGFRSADILETVLTNDFEGAISRPRSGSGPGPGRFGGRRPEPGGP